MSFLLPDGWFRMFFFFFVVVVFGLARDGCLVRSWFGVAQRGGAAGRRGRGGYWFSKANQNQPRPRGLVGFSRFEMTISLN